MNRSTKQIIYYAYILQYNLKKKKKTDGKFNTKLIQTPHITKWA